MKTFWHRRLSCSSLLGLMGGLLASISSQAELPMEELGQHETMPSRHERNIVTISDAQIPHSTDGRVHFVDVDNGNYLGALNTGYWYSGVVLPKTRNVILSPEIYFAHGSRGKRTDIVAFYDPKTLQVIDEVEIPSKRMTAVKPQATSVLSDDEKFLLVLNLTPATSVSVVDLDKREFVTEIDIPGCTYLYPVGNREFNTICADGSFMGFTLTDEGQLAEQVRRDPVFDPYSDPITNGGVRVGQTWYHLSQGSNVHAFTTTDGKVNAEKPWPLVSEDEREDDWRIAGMQHLAIHHESRKLYALMIQGGPEMFEDPAEELWVFDLDSHERVQVIEFEHPALFFNISQESNPQVYAVGVDFQIPFPFVMWLYLTKGQDHLVKMATMSFDIYDAGSGELQRSVPKIGKFPNLIQPW
jgi:methylamine dehydrogenase heavy chain